MFVESLKQLLIFLFFRLAKFSAISFNANISRTRTTLVFTKTSLPD